MDRVFASKLFFLPALVTAFGLSLATLAQAHEPGQITITGRAEVNAAPDMATISMGVVSQADTAAEALQDNNTRLAGVFEVLEAAGIAPRDLQTSGLSVQPNWVYPRNNDDDSNPPRIVGYTVNNNVTVRIRDLDALGEILDAVVRDGANQFHGLSFSVAEPDALIDEARAKAATEAKRRAEMYAHALGISLGAVRQVSESNQSPRPPVIMAEARMMDAAGAPPVPVAQGEVSYSATVTVTWTID